MDTLFGKDVNPSRILNALLLDRFDHSRANRFFSTPWLCSIWPSPHCHLGGNTFPLLMATLDRCFCAILIDAFRDQQLFLSHEEDMNIIQIYIYIYIFFFFFEYRFSHPLKENILYKRFKKHGSTPFIKWNDQLHICVFGNQVSSCWGFHSFEIFGRSLLFVKLVEFPRSNI